MDTGHKRQEADAWLAGIPRSARGSLGAELDRMKKLSDNSVLASLRCLSALPSDLDVSSRASGHVLQALGTRRPPCQAQAIHYQAFLNHKVTQAAANLRKRFPFLDGQQQAVGAHGPKQLHVVTGTPSNDHNERNTQPKPPALPRVQTSVDPTPLALTSDITTAVTVGRKRLAAEALSDRVATQTPVLCSSLHGTPNASDDGAAPTAPAGPYPTVTDACWGVSSGEPAVDQVRQPTGSGGDGSGGGGGDGDGRGEGSAASVMRPLVLDHRTHPQQQRMKPVARLQGATAQHHVAVGPAGPGPVAQSCYNQHAPTAATLAPGAVRNAPYPIGVVGDPVRNPAQQALAPGYGGVQPLVQVTSVPPFSRSDLQGQQAQEGRLSRPHPKQTPKAGTGVGMGVGGLTSNGVISSAAAAAAAAQGGPQAPPLSAPRQQPPGLCPLPAASLTLQQLLNCSGHGPPPAPSTTAARHAGAEPAPPGAPAPTSHLAQRKGFPSAAILPAQPSVADCARIRAAALLTLASPQLRAALEATAAAATARYQAQSAELPIMDRVVRSWPVGELAGLRPTRGPVLAGGMAMATAGTHGMASNASRVSSGDRGLRFLDTTLPRRRSGVELAPDLISPGSAEASPGDSTMLDLELGEALTPDTCQTRQELWELFLMHVSQVAGAGGGGRREEAPQGAGSCCRDEQGSGQQQQRGASCDAMDPMCTSEKCGCGCHGPGCPCTGAQPQGAGALVGTGTETGRSDSDEPDVYISREGLACLASLSQKHYAGGNWQLPFVVVPRQPGDGGTVSGDPAVPGDENAAAVRPRCEGCISTCPGSSSSRMGALMPATIYFGEPFPDEDEILLDCWTRVCLQALSSAQRAAADGGDDQPVATSRGGTQREGDGMEVDGEDCPCCQQDEWLLGDMSLLVLSHSRAGLLAGSAASREAGTCGGVELQVLALAGGSGAGTDAGGGQMGAQAAAVKAATRQCADLACRAELLFRKAETLVMVADPSTGRLLAQHQFNYEALMRLAKERGNLAQDPWQVVHAILSRFRQLPPGPYMISLDASRQCLELRGVNKAVGES